MNKVFVNGKKVYARKKGNLMSLYSSFLDYLLDLPDPCLAYMYSKENGVDTVFDRFLKISEGKICIKEFCYCKY